MFDGAEDALLARSTSWKAVGGRLNVGALLLPSLPRISLDEPGVGGGRGRGIGEGGLTEVDGKDGKDEKECEKDDETSGGGRRAKYRWSA